MSINSVHPTSLTGNFPQTTHFRFLNSIAKLVHELGMDKDHELSAHRFHADLFASGLERILLVGYFVVGDVSVVGQTFPDIAQGIHDILSHSTSRTCAVYSVGWSGEIRAPLDNFETHRTSPIDAMQS